MRWVLPLALLGTLAATGAGRADQPVAMRVPAPELEKISAWINTKPLQLKDLRGKVVVLHFWAFG
jgi:hypothetical protein